MSPMSNLGCFEDFTFVGMINQNAIYRHLTSFVDESLTFITSEANIASVDQKCLCICKWYID